MAQKFNYQAFNFGIFLNFPFVLPWLFLILAAAMNLLLSIGAGASGNLLSASAFLAVLVAVLVAMQFGTSTIVYRMNKHFPDFKMRLFVNVINCSLAAWVPAFVFLMFLGGASMAVADGGVTSIDIVRQALPMSVEIILFLELFILPWTLLITKTTAKYFSAGSLATI